jgi:ubiquinone/menaquinone biosynthesis C-methylase UbiE
MSFLMALFYDRVMSKTEQACLGPWRRELLRGVSGEVLEIGAGTGASIDYYPDAVTRLVLSEPDRHMRRQLADKVGSLGLSHVSVAAGSAERVEAEDASFDYVVTSLVCCSVSNLQASLREIERVLRPGGGFVFLEHVAAARGSPRRRWQNGLNPLWRTFMGNCHLNRETEQAIVDAGFDIERIERESMRKAPPIVRPTIRGLAVKPAPLEQAEPND